MEEGVQTRQMSPCEFAGRSEKKTTFLVLTNPFVLPTLNRVALSLLCLCALCIIGY